MSESASVNLRVADGRWQMADGRWERESAGGGNLQVGESADADADALGGLKEPVRNSLASFPG